MATVALVSCIASLAPRLLLASPHTRSDGAGGATMYVSKLGDGSGGHTWATAFRTLQAALDAVPDGDGGHRIVVRPDTYLEANLLPAHKGAAGAYNVIEADWDGSLGSGASGYAVIDCSDPGLGFKSVDWWSAFAATPDVSSVPWDRWIVRRIYTAGGDAGLFWDLPPKCEPFTIVVEDSVGTGRAFGGGAANFVARPDEPIVFRRCTLWCLDWWGDACGAYVRAENASVPETPDVTFEDCALVGPDNALQAGNPGYHGYTRVKLARCRLVSLNFSQPRGTPSTGIIYSTIEGKLLHVDLEDCTLMGYKVFGAGAGDVGYTTKGSVRAYVQYEQSVPPGFLRIGYWPTEVFQSIIPPVAPPLRPQLTKQGLVERDLCELSPVVWRGRLCLLACMRPATGGARSDYYLSLRDAETGTELSRFAEGYGLASAIEHNDTLYVFASRHEDDGSWNDVTVFWSRDLRSWGRKRVIEQDPPEHLFNSSVCKGHDGFVMAYETDDPAFSPFSVKFAVSKDLVNWEKLPGIVFAPDRYAACPCIRYAGGYYYLLYLEHRTPRWFFETFVARSRDLATWELSALNPVLSPDELDEGINASDPDVCELDGVTRVYYAVGDQLTWMNIKVASYPGPLRDLLEGYFPTL